MKRYELQKVGEAGLLYIEESDLLAARPRPGDPLCPVEIELRYRQAYSAEEGYHYNARARTVCLRLSTRQARALIDQDRDAAGKEFCEECFDFGKSTTPDECARCRVILAMQQAGQGDLRKIRIPLPRPEGCGLPIALLSAVLLFWWTLCRWTQTVEQRDQLQTELAAVRRQKLAPIAVRIEPNVTRRGVTSSSLKSAHPPANGSRTKSR